MFDNFLRILFDIRFHRFCSSSNQSVTFGKTILPVFLLVLFSVPFFVKNVQPKSLDLAIGGYGISIGNSRKINGLRINLRDREVEMINGINLTLWKSAQNESALFNGVSIGLIAPDAGSLRGISAGGLAVAAKNDIQGISFGSLAVGSGNFLGGVAVAGLAVGAGGSIKGITVAGLGVGAGRNISGITLAGLGAAASGNIKGITFALLGAGANRDIYGLTFGGIGAGAGRNIYGLTLAGIGAGAGGNISGLTVGGIGAGAGNELKGVVIGGLGVGAPVIQGLAVGGLAVGAEKVKGITLTLGILKIGEGGEFNGLALASCNRIKGTQRGVSLGLLNYAKILKGIQIGILNIAKNNPRYLKVLPLFNVHLR